MSIRMEYRQINEFEALSVKRVKGLAAQLLDVLDEVPGDPRSLALAKTKLEEAAMWAVHGITA